MLTKVSALILSIIKEWFPISSLSVYVTINTLSEKHYIIRKKQKYGNMTDKKIYSITLEGKQILHDSIVEYIESTDFDSMKLNIAGFMIFHLTRVDAIEVSKI